MLAALLEQSINTVEVSLRGTTLQGCIIRPDDRFTTFWGTRWRSLLRHCGTSRKVAVSIPDGVSGIFPLT